MGGVFYLDRDSRRIEKEKIYGSFYLELLYGSDWVSYLCSKILLPLLTRIPMLSICYGLLQKRTRSRRKILPFIDAYDVDASEFQKSVSEFNSFNDFFVRKLKKEARPVSPDKNIAVLPADGRYLVFPKIHEISSFFVKGQQFNLEKLLKDKELTEKYKNGSLVFARLCPVDYHRFHFPCSGVPSKPVLINGFHYSVSPLALKKKLRILWENKRARTCFKTDHFGDVMFIEVGATNVGSIRQTFSPNDRYEKGDEKGYFEFGGSAVLMLFEKDCIDLDKDLIECSKNGLEVRAKMGQSLGVSSKFSRKA